MKKSFITLKAFKPPGLFFNHTVINIFSIGKGICSNFLYTLMDFYSLNLKSWAGTFPFSCHLLTFFPKSLFQKSSFTLSPTGSALAYINLSPFARSTLGLNRHFPAIFITIYRCLHDLGLYIWKMLTNREMVNFQKLDFLHFSLCLNYKLCHYRSARIEWD